jgi:biotin carboxyl carrier protein
VAAGAHVTRGQDLAVLEAMKMENVIRAPRDGVIAEVCVRQGQQLAHGEPLVRFEPA